MVKLVDLLRMDVAPAPVQKTKGCNDVSNYSKMALEGGHRDLLKLNGIKTTPPTTKKPNDENFSEYAKISQQGGHKDILRTDKPAEPEANRKQKACDTENLSSYNKLAKTGGHKDLLKMNGRQDIDARKAKGCNEASDYSKMAMQGGRKDLLVIEENKPAVASNKKDYQRTGGDWFEHNNNNNTNKNNNNATAKTNTSARPTSAAGKRSTVSGSAHRNQSNGILPGGLEQSSKVGKKRFEPTQNRSEAPFATNW